jgi:HNH endonuclease
MAQNAKCPGVQMKGSGAMGDFSEPDKIKCLLWCDRHCCLCGKACGVDIEVAHIDEKKKPRSSHIDNAIPLCYDCHGKIGRYNSEHPLGNKYRKEELKARRDQIYDFYTRHLVPPIDYGPSQQLANGQRKLPDVGFTITHHGNSNPVKVLVATHFFLGQKDLGIPDTGHYSGKRPWNLNPGISIMGHFGVPDQATNSKKMLRIEFLVTVIDQYERYHGLLPMSWIYMRDMNGWYLEP